MSIDHFSPARPAPYRLDPVQCLIWIGVPVAWIVLLAAIIHRVVT